MKGRFGIYDFGTLTCPAVQAGDADWMDYRGSLSAFRADELTE